MDVVLVSITAVSLVLAIAMGLIVFKLLREDRQRSDARVAMLTAATGRFDPPLQAAGRTVPQDRDVPVPARAELFAPDVAPSAWPRRGAVVAAVAATLAAAAYLVLPGGPAASPNVVPPTALATTPAGPLELMSLHYARDVNALTITGSVQNPRNGTPVSGLFATVLLFAPDGSFLTSARAGLDFTTLSPGDESPFVVTVPVTDAVARYRVGFRTADGTVVGHVDRRPDAASAARHSQPPGTPWAH